MNYPMMGYILGVVLGAEAALMLPSLVLSLAFGERAAANGLLASILLAAAVAFIATRKKPKDTVIFAREAFSVVAFSWIILSAVGALPFFISGAIPSYIDCFFETVSGFTTTGATILSDIEAIPRGLLFWRAFTHWIGGMGVLVFVLILIPSSNGRLLNLMRAESPGPSIKKMVPKLSDNAKILYLLYCALTVIEVIFLRLGGMPLYDSLIHAFSTAGTGGFSCKNLSVAAYDSAYIDWVITIFMLLFGVNFNLYYLAARRHFSDIRKNTEIRVYLLVWAAAVVLITLKIYGGFYSTVGESLRYAAFQAASIITTTGFVTADFNLWPGLCQLVLLMLMIIGASAGSTGGGVKVSRVLIFVKSAAREVRRIIHPRSVELVEVDGEAVEEETLRSVSAFVALYIFFTLLTALLIAAGGYDLVTSLTASMTTIGNTGPGLAAVGPVENFSFFAPWIKLVLSLNMLVGRLEIFPVLIMFSSLFGKNAHFGKQKGFW